MLLYTNLCYALITLSVSPSSFQGSDNFVEDIIQDLATNVTSINLVKMSDNVVDDKVQRSHDRFLLNAVLHDTVTLLTTAAQQVEARGDQLNGSNFVEEIQQVAKQG